MEKDRVVVLGIGNTLLKDEGVGVRVVERLAAEYDLPDNVSIVDGGTQGLWLLSTLQQSDILIVVDAVLGDGPPGTIYRLERQDLPTGLRIKQSAHDSDLIEALNLCELLENGPRKVVVIGVQPSDITPYGLELTDVVAAKMNELVEKTVGELTNIGVTAEKKLNAISEMC